MRKSIILTIALAVIVLIITRSVQSKYKIATGQVNKDSLVTVSFSAVGDLMCHSVQYDYARVNADSFDFYPVYRFIKPFLQHSDFTFGNLETVTAGKASGYSGYPYFNAPDDFLNPLKSVGFDLITTANNHALDRGEEGVLRTIAQLKKNGLNYDGTFTSERDRDSIRIYNIKGIKIAFLAYTYGTNGNPVPKGKPYLINLIDTTLIKHDIITARNSGAEIVLVYYHFGQEYQRQPTAFQQMVVNKTVSYGADIIIGGHPHVIEPTKFFKTENGKLDSGFVAYSLGNFVSNQRWRYSDCGVILTLDITKNFTTDSIYISKVTYLPTWVFKGKTDRGNEYIILPSQIQNNDSTFKFLSESDKFKMLQSYNDTKQILTEYTHNIYVDKIFEK